MAKFTFELYHTNSNGNEFGYFLKTSSVNCFVQV